MSRPQISSLVERVFVQVISLSYFSSQEMESIEEHCNDWARHEQPRGAETIEASHEEKVIEPDLRRTLLA